MKRLRLAGRRGASTLEMVLLIGFGAVVCTAGFRLFGGRLMDKVSAHAERVRTLEPGAAESLDLPEHGQFAPPPEAVVAITTGFEPGHLLHKAHLAGHAYELWQTFKKGLKDTDIESRWGANWETDSDKPSAPPKAREALDKAIGALDPAKDQDLIKQGNDLKKRVGTIAHEAKKGSPSDPWKTGVNKLSTLGLGLFTDYRAYNSVSEWRRAAVDTENGISDYLKTVQQHLKKRESDEAAAKVTKELADQKKALTEKMARVPKLSNDELASELADALFMDEMRKQLQAGNKGSFEQLSKAAKEQAATRAKESVAKSRHEVRNYLMAHYASGVAKIEQVDSYDPRAKPQPSFRRR